jgi:hypothetical protein
MRVNCSMVRPEFRHCALLGALFLSGGAWAQGYYVCQEHAGGKKVAQDKPCRTGTEIKSYAPASDEEIRLREVAARQSKRDFEQTHPGTYRPEEYMTPDELADYRSRAQEREAEQARRNDAAAVEAATRKAAQAEQRAIEAEIAARQAAAKAAAAEEAAANARQPILMVPYPQRLPEVKTPGLDRPRHDRPRMPAGQERESEPAPGGRPHS